jgi:hypothetical protein
MVTRKVGDRASAGQRQAATMASALKLNKIFIKK